MTKSHRSHLMLPSAHRASGLTCNGTGIPSAFANHSFSGSRSTPRGNGTPTVTGWPATSMRALTRRGTHSESFEPHTIMPEDILTADLFDIGFAARGLAHASDRSFRCHRSRLWRLPLFASRARGDGTHQGAS